MPNNKVKKSMLNKFTILEMNRKTRKEKMKKGITYYQEVELINKKFINK